ncbi:MAG TPA: hypothetical protein VEV20_14960 [Burkholderiales bacterium]|nr:hypothetical protein [Burkholderiales bacterium]
MSSPTPDDRELEQLLTETAGLRQRYRASSEEPPAALDDAIRAAARREVSARPRLARSPFSGSWRVPVSIAAVVVVSATLTVMLVERDAHRPRADAPSAKARAEPERKAIESPAPKIEPRAQESDAAERAKSKESARTSERGVNDQLDRRAPPPGPQPFPAQAPAAVPTPAKPATQNTVRSFSQQAPPSAGGAASTLGTSSEPEITAEARQKAESSKDQAGLRDTPAAAGAVAPQERRERAAAPSAAPAAPAAEEALAARALGNKQQGAADVYAESAARPWEHDPAAWLKHIDTLRASGHGDEAKTSFEAFRKRYPDYQLPAGFVVPGS